VSIPNSDFHHGLIGALDQSRFINTCGDERGVMVGEYHEYGVNITPSCGDITSSGGSAHFSWSELNGGFSTGNPHPTWGMVTSGLINPS